MVDFEKVKAIDFHTHAQAPCNVCRDDGHTEFQVGMAAYFPDMPIIPAYPSFPWTEEGLAVCCHKQNVYHDVSDWPAITPERWLANFEKAPLKGGMRQMILKENARRPLGESDG